MTISKNLETAVRERNISDIRGALWSCLMLDGCMTGIFKDSLEYVLSNGIPEAELYEIDDRVAFDETATGGNFDALAGLIRINFSKRKLEALRRIGRVLSPPKQHSVGLYGGARSINGTVQEVPARRGRYVPGRKPGVKAIVVAIVVSTIFAIFAACHFISSFQAKGGPARQVAPQGENGRESH